MKKKIKIDPNTGFTGHREVGYPKSTHKKVLTGSPLFWSEGFNFDENLLIKSTQIEILISETGGCLFVFFNLCCVKWVKHCVEV